MAVPFLALHFASGLVATALLDAAATFPLLLVLCLIRRGHHQIARLALVVTTHIEIVIFSILYGVGSGLENFLMAAALSPFVLFTTGEPRQVIASLACTSLALIFTCVAGALEVPGALQMEGSVRSSMKMIYLICSSALVALLGWALFLLQSYKQATLERISMLNAQTANLASLGEMASNIAHEIASPLAAIELQAALLSRQRQEDAQVTAACQRISGVCARITAIVKAIRSLSRKEQDEPYRAIDPAEAVELAASLCRERFKHGCVSLDVDCPRGAAAVLGDVTQLSQVILNLLGNAFDATDGQSSRRVQVVGRAGELEYRIVVEDNGPGVPDKLRAKVLEPFFTTKPVGKGTGLGLSISRSLVERHGGCLAFEGGAGAMRVVITLPRAAVDTKAIALKAAC